MLAFWLDFLGDILKPITVYDPYPNGSMPGKGELMNQTTTETRRESHQAGKPDAAARRRVILEILTESGGMTAREVVGELHRRGLTPTDERNYAAPRLTELYKAGKIRTTGKKPCPQTGRNVVVWAIRKEV
jgi:hypothetical protein